MHESVCFSVNVKATAPLADSSWVRTEELGLYQICNSEIQLSDVLIRAAIISGCTKLQFSITTGKDAAVSIEVDLPTSLAEIPGYMFVSTGIATQPVTSPKMSYNLR
jgi:hypothetical protein